MRQWPTKENVSGVQGYGRPRRGSGGGSARMAENFRKVTKNFIRDLLKCIILTSFSHKKFQNPALTVRVFWTKNTFLCGEFVKSLKIFDENPMQCKQTTCQ